MDVQTRSSLLPIAMQASVLNTTFLTDGYGVLWLDEDLPSFVTREYALEPFELAQQDQSASVNWIVPTTSYTTELTCTHAQNGSSDGVYVTFFDGKNCTYSGITFKNGVDDNYLLQYIGYKDDAYLDYALESPTCPQTAAHEFFLIWARLSDGMVAGTNSTNTIAAFCETHYYFQPVSATVASLNSSVLSTTPTGPREVLTADYFNSTHFESLINVGYNGSDGAREYPDEVVLNVFSVVRNMGLSWPFNNLVSYALGASQRSAGEYSDPQLLFEAFERAHKLLFALAIHHLKASPQPVSNGMTAVISAEVQSIFVVRVFAILVEGFLAVVIASCLVLLVLYWRRTCCLRGDPASIQDVMKLLPLEDNSLKDFMDLDATDASALGTAIKGKCYMLQSRSEDRSPFPKPYLRRADICLPCGNSIANHEYLNKQNQPKVKAILPIEMSWYYGMPFLVVLSISIALLVMLYRMIKVSNGKSLDPEILYVKS